MPFAAETPDSLGTYQELPGINRGDDAVATRSDVRGFLLSQYRADTDEGNSLRFLFETERGRSQYVNVIGGQGIPYVLVTSPVGPTSAIDANILLALTEDRTMGVKQIGGMYFVVAAALIEDLQSKELLGPLFTVLADADAYEEKLGLGDRL